MINPFTMLGPTTRKVIYMLFGFAIIGAGCADVWYADTDPDWLGRFQDVLTYLAAPISVLAASNTPASPEEVVEAIEEKAAEEDDESYLAEEGWPDDGIDGHSYDDDPNRPV